MGNVDWAIIVGLLIGQVTLMLSLLSRQKGNIESWVREVFVRQSDFARLEGKVEAIETDVVEIKKLVEKIYTKLE